MNPTVQYAPIPPVGYPPNPSGYGYGYTPPTKSGCSKIPWCAVICVILVLGIGFVIFQLVSGFTGIFGGALGIFGDLFGLGVDTAKTVVSTGASIIGGVVNTGVGIVGGVVNTGTGIVGGVTGLVGL
jgi:hypothetical protein